MRPVVVNPLISKVVFTRDIQTYAVELRGLFLV